MDAAASHGLQAADGTALHVVDWPATRKAGARRGVLIMHGLGEHGARHTHVARFFNDCGFDARTYDHRGHGCSGGRRGDVPDETAMLRDAALVMHDFAKRFDAPPLLLGHSMGGLFAARFATARMAPISGLVLSSPALALPLSRAHKLLLAVLSVIAPGAGIANGLPPKYLSHDPGVVDSYRKDPLVHNKISPRLLRSMLASVDFVQQHARELDVPTLLLVAGSDRLVDARGSDAFHARVRAGIGTIRHYPALYHELFNETEAQSVFADLRAWLQQQFLHSQAPAHSA